MGEEMNNYIEEYSEYIKNEKRMAPNSVEAYIRDINEFLVFIESKGLALMNTVENTEVISFVLYLKNAGKSMSTSNRKIASIRGFYSFMQIRGYVRTNPCQNIKSPKVEKKEIEYLTIAEMDKLLSLPDNTLKGIRDRAILEVLYATGIRVSELIEANLEDINLRVGFITCTGEVGKARIVPIGRPARAALEEYVYEGRTKLIKGKHMEDSPLFVNYVGERITRQGLWKLLKEYAKRGEIIKPITPQILRNSFAVHMIQNGADLKSLQELLGHEDMTATQVYLSVTKNRIKEVYDKTHPRA
jgi:integrase/recombinase XerD